MFRSSSEPVNGDGIFLFCSSSEPVNGDAIRLIVSFINRSIFDTVVVSILTTTCVACTFSPGTTTCTGDGGGVVFVSLMSVSAIIKAEF